MVLTPFDLWTNLVMGVFGSPVLFLIFLLLAIVVFTAIMRISNEITITLLVVTSLTIAYYINKLLAIVLLLVLAGIGLAYSRFISRG